MLGIMASHSVQWDVAGADVEGWGGAGEAPARQCLVTRGLLPLLAEGSARATDSDTTDEILHAAIEYSKVCPPPPPPPHDTHPCIIHRTTLTELVRITPCVHEV